MPNTMPPQAGSSGSNPRDNALPPQENLDPNVIGSRESSTTFKIGVLLYIEGVIQLLLISLFTLPVTGVISHSKARETVWRFTPPCLLAIVTYAFGLIAGGGNRWLLVIFFNLGVQWAFLAGHLYVAYSASPDILALIINGSTGYAIISAIFFLFQAILIQFVLTHTTTAIQQKERQQDYLVVLHLIGHIPKPSGRPVEEENHAAKLQRSEEGWFSRSFFYNMLTGVGSREMFDEEKGPLLDPADSE